jgi:hypothetical protein
MANQIQIILIFAAVIIGVVSAVYFYQSAGVFIKLLRKPLRLISGGMFVITLGVLLAAFISYEAQIGYAFVSYGFLPISTYFYILYIIGSVMIAFGARQFTARPSAEVVDVAL